MKKDKKWLKEQIKHEEVDLKYAFDNYEPYEKVLIADDVNDLINQLEEPQQEKVLIPQFVGDWIEKNRDKTTLLDTKAMMIHRCINEDLRVLDWVDDNDDLFIRAWLDGYSVEKKRKYVVEDNKVALLCKFDGKVMPVSETIQDGLHHESLDYELTETEIKDYDERYWAFAEEITK